MEDEEMGEGINTDKVIVNAGGGGESGGAGLAAVIAALGNRNEGGDTAGLIAALGNRNDGMSAMLPALMAGGGMGGGMNAMWPILLLALLRGRGGIGGGGDDCCGPTPAEAAMLQTLMEGQSDLRAQVPTTALETQNAIQAALSSLALGTQQGFAGVKDSVQATLLSLSNALCGVNQNVSAQGCQTRERVDSDGDKTRALLISRFQQEDATKIAEQNARIVALETRCDHDRHHAETQLSISNTNTAVAQQQQQQRQDNEDRRHRELLSAFVAIGNTIQSQRNRSEQDIINLGTMLASGTQTPTTTQIGNK